MERAITASDANQRFSEMLRAVQGGDTFVVTSRGRPVARVVSVDEPADQKQKIAELLDFVRTLPVRHAGDWRREDLYE
jgi:prevent-host-death family protein